MRELSTAEFSYGHFANWAVFFVSLGGRAFRVTIARRLFPEARQGTQQSVAVR